MVESLGIIVDRRPKVEGDNRPCSLLTLFFDNPIYPSKYGV